MPTSLCWLRQLSPLLFLLLPGQPAQAQEVPYRLAAPALGTYDQRVLPGGSGSLTFTLTNQSSAAGSAVLAGYFHSRSTALQGYAFTPSDTRCGTPTFQRPGRAPLITFPVGPLAANESLTCTYQITRNISSPDDLRFLLCGPLSPTDRFVVCDRIFRIGTLPDQGLAVEPAGVLSDGRQLVRVRVVNYSPVAIASRVVSTECLEFDGGEPLVPAFSIETDFEGACPVVAGYACFDQATYLLSYGFDLGPLPAGGEASCLVRLRPREPSRVAIPGPVGIQFLDDRMVLASGGDGYDANSANDATVFGLRSIVESVPIPPRVAIALALLLGLMGLWALRRRRRARH